MDPFELKAGNLYIRDLRESDVPAASKALVDPQGWLGQAWGAHDENGARKYLEFRLASKNSGEGLPLIYFVDDAVAGVSGLHCAVERRKCVEIGFTAVSPAFRRTCLNTRVKEQLLHYCFNQLGAVRVEFRVDARNFISQTAMLRLGARFDGKIDHWAVTKNNPHPVGHIYSITLANWPDVRERLTALRERRPPLQQFLPERIEGPRLRLERSKLADAAEFFDLVTLDQDELAASFPQLGCMKTLDEMKAYIADRAHTAADGSGFHYIARDQSYSSVIGHVQIKRVDWKRGSCELGYHLAPEFRKRGFGTEMLALTLRNLEKMSRITVRVLPENIASLALARKLKFEHEGLLRSEHITSTGERRDVFLLGLTRRDERSPLKSL